MFGELQDLIRDSAGNIAQQWVWVDVFPERSEDPTGRYWKKLHHKKQTLYKPKKGPFQQETSLPNCYFHGTFEFSGKYFFCWLSPRESGRGNLKPHDLMVLPGGPTGQFAAKPTATATENGHSARLDL